MLKLAAFLILAVMVAGCAGGGGVTPCKPGDQSDGCVHRGRVPG